MLRHYRLAVLPGLIMLALNARGEDALNLSFIQGDAKTNIPEILSSNKKYPAGQYVVDVIFNKESLGRHLLSVTPQDGDTLCLATEWINTVGLPLRKKIFAEYQDVQRQCYNVERYPGARIDLDYGSQTLRFSIPQVAVNEKISPENWDFGIPGFRLSWAGNISKSSSSKKQAYGNFDMNINAGRWVLSGKTSGFSDRGFSTPEATLSTIFPEIRGKLLMGKTMTNSTLLPDFGFYGISLRSDSTMVPWNLSGYAPQIDGVAATNARVTVSQAGYTILSEIVPPGAFSFNSVRPVSNGDLTVIIEEEDGTKKVRTYPVTTLPTLLRAGDYNYNLAAGNRANTGSGSRDLKGVFALGSLDYGFKPLTLNTATVIHENYQSIGVGMTKDYGAIGAFSTSVNASRSIFDNQFTKYNSRHTQYGFSGLIKYAKGLGSQANLQLLSYRYTGEKYVDFAEFNPEKLYNRDNRKERYEAIISQNIDNTFISASGWIQSYRNFNSKDSGVNINVSTLVDKVSVSLNANYGKYHYDDKDDYGISLSVSVPFQVFERPHFSTSSVTHNSSGKTVFNTGVNGSTNENVDYSINSSISEHNRNVSAYAGINLSTLQAGMSISQTDKQTGLSFSASGSVIGTEPTGILFSREQNSTVAVTRLKDVPGVRFNSSSPTNKRGVTSMYVSPYNSNDIRINTENVPENIELKNSVYSVIPTERAIIYRDFAHTEIKRYILRVKSADGKPLSAGSQAKTEQGINAGFVANGGVLIVNVLAEPNEILVSQYDGKQCRFSMQGMTAGDNKLKEVRCE
ncbi:outer membrane usher protein PefC [Salmonella enterica subsp. enterica serovar Richmond]|nr:outer membrane usher protein PefC [Salmonella enterica subsp. enterica serovar Richmond]EAA2047853.1 outer membrane usher protein PefC [Salmonella enterica subsp. enterica serovar Chester]EAB8017784.1 outer membrane usher protein PefC [Salmonella enterica subsp. enterica serovar Newport]EAC1168461.1 outer membrane usher protein PefC [Salmonella enterica subsp. enterica serovar Typhimurium]EAP0132941.1 outer membrane usher protein PefC [Salmonella enterica]EBH3089499.1 outer membrane usher p